MYNTKHQGNYETSMSACINWICFRPSIIEVSGVEDIKQRIVGEKKSQVVNLEMLLGGGGGSVV